MGMDRGNADEINTASNYIGSNFDNIYMYIIVIKLRIFARVLPRGRKIKMQNKAAGGRLANRHDKREKQ